MAAGCALVEVGQVISENVTQASKLCSTLVGEAELEGLGGCHGIQSLQAGVVAQDVQHRAVSLPQKLEPGGDQLPVGTVLQAGATRDYSATRRVGQSTNPSETIACSSALQLCIKPYLGLGQRARPAKFQKACS